MTKTNQTALTKGSAICSKCRLHLQITLEPPSTISHHVQDSTNHVHHLVYKDGQQVGANSSGVTSRGQTVERFHYECSYLACTARVSVEITSPILSGYLVWMLTDPELLRKRTEDAIAAHPARLEGMGQPLAIDVLMNLRTYITNALEDRQRSKSISAVNKRFMNCFGVEGQPCRDILEFLEFTYKVCNLGVASSKYI